MTNYIVNAFSLGMVDPAIRKENFSIRFSPLDLSTAEAREQFASFKSCVGHVDTAAIFSSILGFPVEHNRSPAVLVEGNELLLGAYTGPRLPEGSTTLPEGAVIEWFSVRIVEELSCG